MSKSRNDTGLGLDALLSAKQPPSPVTSTLPVASITPSSFQPRRRFDDIKIAELADSIKQNGLIEPIVVRPVGGDQHEIIAGERRWRASKRAGLTDVPVVIRDATDQQALALALIENLQREDLTAIEEARGIRRLVDEFDLSHSEAGELVGRSRSTVTNLLRLLDLSEEVQNCLEDGSIDMGHARALLTVEDEVDQIAAARQVITRGLSVRQTERMLSASGRHAETTSGHAAEIALMVPEAWRERVRIRWSRQGSATITLQGLTPDELRRVLELLNS